MSTDQAGSVRDVGEREARQVAEEAREAGWQKPSFGKQLYLGDFQLDLIHPHPRPSEESTRAARSSAPGCGSSSSPRSTARSLSGMPRSRMRW